ALVFRRQADDQRGGDEALERGRSFEFCESRSGFRVPGSEFFRRGRLPTRNSKLGTRNCPRRQPRRVDDDIHFLRALDLKNFGDGMAAFGGGFPVDFIVTVAGNVFAQFLKLPAFADLPLGVQTEGAAIEKQRRQTLSLGEQVGVNADCASGWHAGTNIPKTQWRTGFEISLVELKISALAGLAGPSETRPFAVTWKKHPQ